MRRRWAAAEGAEWRRATAVLVTIMLAIGPLAVPERTQGGPRTIHVADNAGDLKFRAHLNAAFAKRKVPLVIVSDPAEADYVLHAIAMSRGEGKEKWHEGWLTPRRASAAAAVQMLDRCGSVAWSETAGDLPDLDVGVVAAPFGTGPEPAEPGPQQTRIRVGIDKLVGRLAKGGPEKVADRIARRLRTAIRHGEVRPSPRSCS